MKEFFRNKLDGINPYDYQLKVMQALLDGKNVILSVPTGAGKTWASIMPFLYAQTHPEIHFPAKMIYSLPLRTLANSIYEDVSEIVKGTSIQTGEYANDIYFENDIVFSTIDQTLSNFLCFPLPLSNRQANINAGALIGSYLVFDEFHLLDEELSMATTIGALKMLGNLCRCCIMTATLSEGFMDALTNELDNYEIITLDDFPKDKERIGSLKPKINKKQIKVANGRLSAENIISLHIKKSIVICNRVEIAQQVFNDLIVEQKKSNSRIANAKIICLHSRFFESDRKAKEKELKNLFGKKANDQSVILIATQVIEAGMDISCEVMHTEISPISSFLQRAGRCARFDNQIGTIFIYDVLDIEEQNQLLMDATTLDKDEQQEIKRLNNKYLPYNSDECRKTLVELVKYQTLEDGVPKQLIEAILGSEKKIIAKMKTGQSGGFNQDKIIESWETCQKNYYRNTIRDIQSIEITLINDKTRTEIEKYPFKYQSLSMYKWSFVGWLNRIYNSEYFDKEDWLVMELKEADDIFLENDESTTYELKKINQELFKSLPQQIYVNAKYFGYDVEFGFNYQFEKSFNNHAPLREIKGNTIEIGALTKDSFVEHNLGLIGAFEKEFLGKNRNRLDFISREIAKYIDTDFKTEDLIQAIYLMIVLHDYGKLNDNWQKPMQKYQAMKEGASFFNEVLAHTDYDDKTGLDKQIAKETLLHKRPSHAGVGALVAQEIVHELFDGNDYLKSSISMAIARHHSPLSKSYPQFNISEKNYQAVQELLDRLGFEIELNRNEKYAGEVDGFQFQGFEEQVLYLFFVRILRLCDQKATENLKAYLN